MEQEEQEGFEAGADAVGLALPERAPCPTPHFTEHWDTDPTAPRTPATVLRSI